MRWMIGSSAMALTIDTGPADVADRRLRRRRDSILRRNLPSGLTQGMAPNRLRAATASDPHRIPPALVAWLSVFRSRFIAPVWQRVLVLVAGAVLAPGKRTVSQALRVMGLGEAPQFRRYHEVLGRSRWDARAVARRLLLHLLERLLPSGPVVIGIDDTIERRWAHASRRAASIATRCGPRRGTSSKPVGYTGCR
jgi:DDE superfamily endonuclease